MTIKLGLSTGLLALSLLLSLPVAGAEELTQEKRDAIRELMETTGATEIGTMFGNAFVQQISASLQRSNPNVPTRAYEILREEVMETIERELGSGEFFDLLYPIYHKHLTLNDIRELIAFYQTPIGRKAISVLPQLTRESMAAGQRWGQQLGPIIQERVMARFEQEGIKLGN